MAIILQQLLSSVFNDRPSPYDKNTNTWVFNQKTSKKNAVFFRQLVKEHHSLQFEYSVLCSQLAHDKTITLQQIELALLMAGLLEHVYCYYLVIPREVMRIRGEQAIYRDLLQLALAKPKPNHASLFASKTIRELTVSSNWPRLFLLRVRRLLLTINPLTVNLPGYRQFINGMEHYTDPVIPYVSWIFFIPRLLTNLCLTAKHVIPGAWMGEHERNLGWQTRFNAQMSRRWFELGNDSVWFTFGLIGCFVLTGVLAPISFYIGVGCQAFDVMLASVRAHVELSRLTKIEEKYTNMLAQDSIQPADREQIEGFLFHLQRRIAHEKKRVYLSVINNCVLLLTVILILPLFVSTPVIPLLGAILSVLNTILCYSAMKYIDSHKPSDKLQKESLLTKCSFFHTPPDSKSPPKIDFTPNELAASIT